ncbi:MAG TPA: AAA family ATPase [Polyangia bacterium]|nr:AAA family ATPase [Polyangia bacterium]
MATAHLIHGFLGAGKTTFARRLEREHDAVRFTHDEWMSALYGSDPPAEHFAEFSERVFRLMETVWTRVLASGVDVVLDDGMSSRKRRDALRDTVRALGGESKLYSLRCSEAVARARCRARNADLAGSLYISDATFDALRARFQPLDDDEAHELVDTDTTP